MTLIDHTWASTIFQKRIFRRCASFHRNTSSWLSRWVRTLRRHALCWSLSINHSASSRIKSKLEQWTYLRTPILSGKLSSSRHSCLKSSSRSVFRNKTWCWRASTLSLMTCLRSTLSWAKMSWMEETQKSRFHQQHAKRWRRMCRRSLRMNWQTHYDKGWVRQWTSS